MGMSGTGAAGQAYVNQRAGNSSGLTQFLKLDGAFKQAIMLQRQKDMEEGRRLQYTTEAKATEGGLDRTSAKEISEGKNQTDIKIAGMTGSGSEFDVKKYLMNKYLVSGYESFDNKEKALWNDVVLRPTLDEKMMSMVGGIPGFTPQSNTPLPDNGGKGMGGAAPAGAAFKSRTTGKYYDKDKNELK